MSADMHSGRYMAKLNEAKGATAGYSPTSNLSSGQQDISGIIYHPDMSDTPVAAPASDYGLAVTAHTAKRRSVSVLRNHIDCSKCNTIKASMTRKGDKYMTRMTKAGSYCAPKLKPSIEAGSIQQWVQHKATSEAGADRMLRLMDTQQE